MESLLSVLFNYLLAVYYRYKSMLIGTFIKSKSYIKTNRLNLPEKS
jgi:hypothetical protein